MEKNYQPYFKIFVGDKFISVGYPILFVTSHKHLGAYGSEYFAFFENQEEMIFSKRIVSRKDEINGLTIGPNLLFEEAFKAGKGELLNHLVNQISDCSNRPVSFKEFELEQKEESDFIRLSLFNPSISEIIRSIAPKTKCHELYEFISKVLVAGNFRFSDI
jgi:hypothetical protein